MPIYKYMRMIRITMRILSLLIIVLGLFSWRSVFTYEVTTHANLTSVMFDFYNKNFPDKKIDEQFRAVLVEGSRREDDDPRWLNHFYDPINNRGLSWNNLSWEKSKDWAEDEKTQASLIYKSSLASLIGLAHGEPLIFTWQKAIEEYNNGDYQNSFLTLGHILHLLEDASVPEHTRNDPHPNGAPYEEFTKNLVPKIDDWKKPITLKNLNDYFDAIAQYSNNNFYSFHTLDNKNYKSPEPDYITQDGDYSYGFKVGDDGQNYHLVNYGDLASFSWGNNGILLDGNKNKILTDYWRFLSQKDIQYGAGVIDLFFQEAAKTRTLRDSSQAQNDSIKIASSTVVVGTRNDANGKESFLASALGALKSLVTGIDDFQQVSIVDLSGQNTNKNNQESEVVRDSSQPSSKASTFAKASVDKSAGTAQAQNDSIKITSSPVANRNDAVVKNCVWDTIQLPSRQKLIINEINWEGSTTDSSDEWLEFKNISGGNLNLNNWQLLSKSGNIKIKFGGHAGSANISAGNFILLARGKDYKGALKNSDDGLRIFDDQCSLLDEVLANPNWPAGNNKDKRSAERDVEITSLARNDGKSGWHDGNPNSPGRENSSVTVSGGSGGGGGGNSPLPQPSSQVTVNTEIASSSAITVGTSRNDEVSGIPHVVLNEIFFDAIGSDDSKEFIELYNSGDQVVDISGWTIQHQSLSGSLSKKNFEKNNSIPAKSFFLVWLGGSSTTIFSPEADMRWLSGSLNNSGATISLMNGTTTIDTVTYGSGQVPMPATGQSLERDHSAVSQPLPAGFGGQAGNNWLWKIQSPPTPENSKKSLNVVASGATNSSSTTTNSASSTAEKILKDLFFYADPRASSSDYLIEFTADKYPFISSSTLGSQNYPWRGIIFYLNQNPEPIANIDGEQQLSQIKNLIPLQYETCANPGSNPLSKILLFPNDADHCGNAGGPYNLSYNFNNIEENHFLIKTSSLTTTSTLTDKDYLTVAYYTVIGTDYALWGIGYPHLELVATDKTKYFFQTNTPEHQSPKINGALNLNFDRQNSRLKIDWPAATDGDTLDKLLTYEIRYQDEDKWQLLGHANNDSKFISDPDNFKISVRAKDDFGNYSQLLTANWFYPSTNFFVNQPEVGSVQYGISFGEGNYNCVNSDNSACLNSAAIQSFTADNDQLLNTVTLKIKQEMASDYADLSLAIYGDGDASSTTTGIGPDINNKISETVISSIYLPDKYQELSFYFPTPVNLVSGKKYWLILGVKNYTDGRGLYRNQFKVLINDNGIDSYSSGQAENGNAGFCDHDKQRDFYKDCHFYFENVTEDFYMKLGLGE